MRLSNEIVAIRQNNLRLLSEELRAAKDRFEVGEVTRTDVAQAESRLANARSGARAGTGGSDTGGRGIPRRGRPQARQPHAAHADCRVCRAMSKPPRGWRSGGTRTCSRPGTMWPLPI